MKAKQIYTASPSPENIIYEIEEASLKVEQFETIVKSHDALILDTRHKKAFVKAHIPNSLFIGLDGAFTPWLSALISDFKQPIIFIAPAGKEKKVITSLVELGYVNVLGYLEGGMEVWQAAGKRVDSIESITAKEFGDRLNSNNLNVLDVRRLSEFEAEHVECARSFPLDNINENIHSLNKNDFYYLYSRSGYRSLIASSILKSRAYGKVIYVAGGMGAIYSSDIKRTDFLPLYYLNG